jgi:hypothetical protein
MTEAELLANVVKAARWRGWWAYHTHDSRRSESGFPDLVLVRKGRLIFAELKSAIGKASQAQAAWLTELYGIETVETYLWRPSDWLTGRIDEVLT